MTYRSLGVRPVLNASGAQSRLGGSLLSQGVRDAMALAAQSFIDLPFFHDRAGEELARMTKNEAACVSNGAAAGILVSVAACLTGDSIAAAAQLPKTEGLEKQDLVVWRKHVEGVLAGADQVLHNGYLSAVAMAGGTLRIIDEVNDLKPSDAGMLWFPHIYPHVENEKELFDVFLDRAHLLNIPFIVDAADQVPPVSNLWHFTRDKGADLAIFSGGKGLKGPGASGLIVGRKDLIRFCRVNSGPEHSVGRPAKVGKEEIAGLLAAVEEAVATNPVLDARRWNDIVDQWLIAFVELEPLGILLRKSLTSHSGQPIPRVVLALSSADRAMRDEIINFLWEQDPRIAVLPEEGVAIALNPQMIGDDEINTVSKSVIFAITTFMPK